MKSTDDSIETDENHLTYHVTPDKTNHTKQVIDLISEYINIHTQPSSTELLLRTPYDLPKKAPKFCSSVGIQCH